MTVITPIRRPAVAARRFGYILGVLVNAAMLYLANVWPGWQSAPLLTENTTRVLWLFNVSVVVGMAVNVLYLAYDPVWLTALGAVMTTGIGLAVLVRVWQVFPFDFGASGIDWGLVVRIALVVAVAGTAVAIVVQVVSFFRAVCR